MMIILNSILVNHCTDLRGLTSKGKIACTKRPSVRAGVEIITKALTDSYGHQFVTNLNSKVGSEVPPLFIQNKYLEEQGGGYYVVCPLFSQLKLPISSSNKNDGSPKSVFYQKQTEFGIS
jgi:hypothetical protein